MEVFAYGEWWKAWIVESNVIKLIIKVPLLIAKYAEYHADFGYAGHAKKSAEHEKYKNCRICQKICRICENMKNNMQSM